MVLRLVIELPADTIVGLCLCIHCGRLNCVTSTLRIDFKLVKYSFSFIFRVIIDPIIILLPKVSLLQL